MKNMEDIMGNKARKARKTREKNAANDALICATRLIKAGLTSGYGVDPAWFICYRAQKLSLVS
jgi:hypothetical protein